MKILLLGGHGLVGSALRVSAGTHATKNENENENADVEIAAPRRVQVDVTDRLALARAVDAADPAWIINCAAFTAVDAAEDAPSEAMRVNAEAVQLLGVLAAARGARVLHFSTDYVFDGARATPWREDDPTAPRSAYARSKRTGEEALLSTGAAALIVRTSWLYGAVGRNFPATMWTRAQARTPSQVVNDQRGAPTFASDLARWCWTLIAQGATGIVHATNAGSATWLDVAERVYARAGWPEGVTATTSAAIKSPAPRPAYSVLDCTKFDALVPSARRPWESALDEYLDALSAERAA